MRVLSESTATYQEPTHTTRSLRILLAEDNHVNQRLATRLLEKRGHLVSVVENGREALDALYLSSFDLVLMDVQMPVMDGIEATKALRQSEAASSNHQPIIALTAHAMKGDLERCMGAGMDGYLSKPIRPQELDRLLEEYLETEQEPSRGELMNRIIAGGPDGSGGIPVDVHETARMTPTNRPALEELMNIRELLDRLDQDRELLLELLGLFQTELPGLYMELRAALDLGAMTRVRVASHTLKGMLGNLSMTRSAERAAEVENLAEIGNAVAVQLAFEEFDRDLAVLVPAVIAYVENAAR